MKPILNKVSSQVKKTLSLSNKVNIKYEYDPNKFRILEESYKNIIRMVTIKLIMKNHEKRV